MYKITKGLGMPILRFFAPMCVVPVVGSVIHFAFGDDLSKHNETFLGYVIFIALLLSVIWASETQDSAFLTGLFGFIWLLDFSGISPKDALARDTFCTFSILASALVLWLVFEEWLMQRWPKAFDRIRDWTED